MRAHALLLPLALLGTGALAQVREKNFRELRLDLSPPEIPAILAVGASPTTVSRPGNARDLALALAQGLGPDGKIQNGLAIEVSPVKILGPYADWLQSKAVQNWLGGLRFSAASNIQKGAGDDLTTQAAVAVRYSLISYNPLTDTGLEQCLDQALPPPFPVGAPPLDPTAARPTVEIVTPNFSRCRAAFRAAHLADTALQLAYTHVFESLNNPSIKALKPIGGTLWVSLSLGFNSFASKLAGASDDYVASLKAKATQEALQGAIGFEPLVFVRLDTKRIAGTSDMQIDGFGALRLPILWDGGSIFLEGGVKAFDLTKKTAVTTPLSVPVGVGLEMRLSNGTWIGLFFGGDVKGEQSLFSLGNIRYSFGEAAPF